MPTAAAAGSEVLFEPFRLGPLRLPNRLVMAPMGTCLDGGGQIGDATIAYYRRRAAGGVGTVTVEGCLVSADSAGPEPRICGPEFLPGLRRLVTALRPFGVTVGVQLMHPGRQVVEGPVVAPSPVPLRSRAPVPHELTAAEIAAIVEDFGRAAGLARAAGFDFVEVHGAHGYLLSDFLSPLANQRRDRYGGSIENRARLSVEVAEAIVTGYDGALPLVWRMNGDDGLDGGLTVAGAIAVAQRLEAAGVTAFSVSAGTWRSLHVTLAPMFTARGHLRHLARAIKRSVAAPVIAVGRLDDPALAAEVVTGGDADLVLLGRALIAEPDWPRKARAGDGHGLRPCIACNACVDAVGRGLSIRCAVNPEVGRELGWRLEPARRPRRVMVVGGGPAGMEAAEVARVRGHDVSLWDRDARLGGKLEIAGLAPSKGEVARFRDYKERRLEDLGVRVRLGVDVTPETVAAERPDVVVVATGADPSVPPIPGVGAAHVHDAEALLRGDVAVRTGDRVVVVGGSATGCETAELLVDRGADVTIVEMGAAIGHGIEAITRRHLARALDRSGARVLTRSRVVAIERDAVVFEGADGGRGSVAADLVALAVGWAPRGSVLAGQLEGVDVVVLGDAVRPADFVHAVWTGADAARAI
jgi:2,4-dienoyl-CoA reductase (NADPH2)